MWDTEARVPFDLSLLSDHHDAGARDRLLALIRERPGISVDELHALHLPGLFAHLRAFHREGLIHASTTPPRFFERETRVYPAAEPTVSEPSSAIVQPGLCATSQTCPSGSAKYPE